LSIFLVSFIYLFFFFDNNYLSKCIAIFVHYISIDTFLMSQSFQTISTFFEPSTDSWNSGLLLVLLLCQNRRFRKKLFVVVYTFNINVELHISNQRTRLIPWPTPRRFSFFIFTNSRDSIESFDKKPIETIVFQSRNIRNVLPPLLRVIVIISAYNRAPTVFVFGTFCKILGELIERADSALGSPSPCPPHLRSRSFSVCFFNR